MPARGGAPRSCCRPRIPTPSLYFRASATRSAGNWRRQDHAMAQRYARWRSLSGFAWPRAAIWWANRFGLLPGTKEQRARASAIRISSGAMPSSVGGGAGTKMSPNSGSVLLNLLDFRKTTASIRRSRPGLVTASRSTRVRSSPRGPSLSAREAPEKPKPAGSDCLAIREIKATLLESTWSPSFSAFADTSLDFGWPHLHVKVLCFE